MARAITAARPRRLRDARSDVGTRGTGPQSDATLRVGATLGLPAVLQDLGVNPAVVLAEAGVPTDLFADPDNRMSYRTRARLLQIGEARSGCPHLGLLVGMRGDIDSLGLLGVLAKHSIDAGAALASIVDYFRLQHHGATVALAVDGGIAEFSYDLIDPSSVAAHHIGDGALAEIGNVLRSLCGRDWAPIEVRFAHAKPADLRPYRAAFRAPLRFDCERNSVVFASSWLGRRLPGADEELQRLLRKQMRSLEIAHGEAFADKVRVVLGTALLTGHHGADQVAALFSIHGRTLHRRLAADGASYRQLLDEGRHAIVCRMLRDTRLGVTEIAAALDYSDASSLTRAFRRWSGTTPAAWRRLSRRRSSRPGRGPRDSPQG